MIELINAIPENIGWVMVGVLGTLCVVMFIKLGGIIVEMIKDYKEVKESLKYKYEDECEE